ncbi:unknown [Clostridium sp. CAG:354]|jgi:hypothetical protein|nr:hypothetical protein [Clostridium sp.]CDE11081.1 unknown [Clostridium sp. CAG:354]
MQRELKDCRTIGFRRSNKGRTSNVYMIRECDNCHAILEFPSDEVSTKVNMKEYEEYIICPNCLNKVTVLQHK